MRSQHRLRELGGANSIPITVRQLEAIVRLSESLAKMTLFDVATEVHVEEAIRLFTVSTVDAINSGEVSVDDQMTEQTRADVENAERLIKRQVQINSTKSEKKLVQDIARSFNMEEKIVRKAIQVMVARDELQYTNKGKNIRRTR